MSNDKVLYGIAIIAGAGIAIWAGLPPILLLFLACPIAMTFMMRGMSGMGGMHGGNDDQNLSTRIASKVSGATASSTCLLVTVPGRGGRSGHGGPRAPSRPSASTPNSRDSTIPASGVWVTSSTSPVCEMPATAASSTPDAAESARVGIGLPDHLGGPCDLVPRATVSRVPRARQRPLHREWPSAPVEAAVELE